MPRVRLPITTERLVVRSFRPGDEADVFAYRSVPEVVRYIPGDPKTEEQVADLVAERRLPGASMARSASAPWRSSSRAGSSATC